MKYLSENVKSLGKILLAMFVVTVLLLLILAFFLQRLGLEEGAVSIGIGIVYAVSCFLGGFLAGKVQKTKKFVWGILMGLMYVVAMLAVSMAVKHGLHSTMSTFIINLLLCLGSGMLGGMVS